MNEAAGAAAGPLAATSAGRLLREARERQGLHIAALAASIKVTQKKLELLEADRFDALPDATFTRALAQTVCRALKIDPAAVLGLLPPAGGYRLEQLGEGLNAPFRERPGVVQRDAPSFAFGWAFWLTTLILVASVVLYFLPSGWLSIAGWRSRTSAAPAASAAARDTRAPISDSTAPLFPPQQEATPLPPMPDATPLPGVPAASSVGAAENDNPVTAAGAPAPQAAPTAELK
jgi:cytoskeleton protein RodZ